MSRPVDNSKTLKECVVRECMEELGVQICVKDIFAEAEYEYPDRTIKFTFFKASIESGEPQMLVHDDMQWVSRDALSEYKFCPADIEVIERLNGRVWICKKADTILKTERNMI